MEILVIISLKSEQRWPIMTYFTEFIPCCQIYLMHYTKCIGVELRKENVYIVQVLDIINFILISYRWNNKPFRTNFICEF